MKKQKGLTLITWLVIIAILAFNGLLALNVVPVFINDSSVKSIMKGLETDSSVRGVGPAKIKDIVSKRLRINNIYDITNDKIKIKKTRTAYLVTIEYEPRGKLVGPLDYIVSFKHEARIQLK